MWLNTNHSYNNRTGGHDCFPYFIKGKSRGTNRPNSHLRQASDEETGFGVLRSFLLPETRPCSPHKERPADGKVDGTGWLGLTFYGDESCLNAWYILCGKTSQYFYSPGSYDVILKENI